MKLRSSGALALCLCAVALGAEPAAAILEKAGVRGGLCLVIGAKDTALSSALAAKTNLYVQVLQPDAGTAAAWGAVFAVADWRENAGVRSAAFDPEHYGGDLFNLIVVEDAAALGKAGLSDLCRILVPNGVAAFRNAPGALAQGAGKLAMTQVSLPNFAAAFRKPFKPVEWKVCDSLKWRAGTRSQHCAGFAGFVVKDGTVTYHERMEAPGDIAASRAQLMVRDAYNGRIVSAGEVSDKEPNWSATRLAAEIAGRRLIPDPDRKSHWAGGCYKAIPLGKYILSHHNIWDNTETKERVFPYLVHPACFIGPIPAEGLGLVYNLPSRKESVISGITAIAPADIEFDHEPGGRVHRKFAPPPAGVAAAESDWPMFRSGPDRGNSVSADPGQKPAKAWGAQVGRGPLASSGQGGRHYGIMSGERTGLTQPVSAWGLVVVADIDAQRVVALDAATGAQKWVFHVGSRVDFSPTLYKGLCIFSAKDGWVYGLDAARGTLVWKLLIDARERYIGGHEKLESLWPACGDVLVADGVGYASSGFGFAVLGGVRAVAFKPETGEPLWGQCYHAPLNPVQEKQGHAGLFTWKGEKGQVAMGGHCVDAATGALVKKEVRGRICPADDCLAFGNSLARNAEDRYKGQMSDSRLRGRTLAASADLSVVFVADKDKARVGRREFGGALNLIAAKEPKKELWKSPPIELVVDDIVITPKQVYCVGHYERVKKDPELWVLSREDGKVLATVPVDGFPAFNGMSAAGDRLFVATREGKLICYRSK